MMKENIIGLIIDLDGVLFDSEYYQWQGWVIPLREFGIELTKEMYFEYAGKSGKQIDQELIRDFNLNVEIGYLWEKKKKLLEKWFSEKAMPLLSYAREIVEHFIANPQFRVMLCSGGDREEVAMKLTMNDFLKYFPDFVAGNDVARSKPWPDTYVLAAEKLGLRPDQCWAIEDTEYGLEAAKGAGIHCFVIPNEYSVKQNFSKADGIFSSLKDVIDFFDN